MNRESAWQLVSEHVKDRGLQRHMLAVEAAMRWYAEHLHQDVDDWGVVGLIHDFDWEIHPSLPEHPVKGAEILRARGVDESIIRTVLSHYTAGTGVEREQPIDFALLACDEITGLMIAAVLVRPSRDIRDLTVKSVKKKWKGKSFAAGIDRDHVTAAVADFSKECFDSKLELWDHIANVVTAMQRFATELDLDGQLAADSEE